MPQIKQFDTPALGLRPTETGIETTAGNARRIGTFYNQVAGAKEQLASDKNSALRSVGNALGSGIQAAGAAYVNYLDHKEISAGAAKGTELMATLTDQWNKLISNPKLDPNDPTIKQKFMQENLEPALQQFKDDSGFFTTDKSQQFAESFIERFRNHMETKTSGDMSTLAGIALKRNVETTVNSLSAMASSDPSSVKTALDTVDHSIGAKIDTSPTLDPTTKAKVRSEVGLKARQDIVMSGALGAIMKSSDPEGTAADWLKRYPSELGGEAKTLAGYARQQVRAQNYDFETNRRREKEIATDKSNDARDSYITAIYSKDPRIANDPTGQKILNDPNLLPSAKANLLALQARELKPETDSRISQQTFIGLLRDLRQPNADPDAVMQKAWDARVMDPGKPGSLTERDFNQMRAEIVARKTPEGAALEHDRNLFFKNYATAIAGSTYQPGLGDPKLYNAEMDARRMEAMLKSKGLDPHLAYDPSSEYFLGRNERVQKWQQSMQVDLSTRAEKPAAAAKPEVPFYLRGIASLSRNSKTGQYRDDTSGQVYNADGSPVK